MYKFDRSHNANGSVNGTSRIFIQGFPEGPDFRQRRILQAKRRTNGNTRVTYTQNRVIYSLQTGFHKRPQKRRYGERLFINGVSFSAAAAQEAKRRNNGNTRFTKTQNRLIYSLQIGFHKRPQKRRYGERLFINGVSLSAAAAQDTGWLQHQEATLVLPVLTVPNTRGSRSQVRRYGW